MRFPLALLALVAFPAAASAELRSVSLSGRLSFDFGTIFVPGVQSGIGGGVGLRVAFGDTAIVGSGDPALDFINSAGVEVSLRFAR